MKVLVLDAHLGERCDHAEALVGKGRRVSRSTRISEDDFCELLAMDYGDEASAEVVRDALRYRAENPRCRVAVVRVLDAHWSSEDGDHSAQIIVAISTTGAGPPSPSSPPMCSLNPIRVR